MHGHEYDAVSVRVVAVHIRIERDICKVALKGIVPGLLHIVDDARFKLAHVLDAGNIIDSTLGLKREDVAGFSKQLVIQCVGCRRLCILAQLFY